MAETWRVVLRDGSVREVVVYRDDSDSPYSVSTHRWCAGGMRSRTAHGAVVSAMSLGDEPVREILAPGDPTRTELATALAIVTAELDALRAQLAPLVACVDALRAAARAAGWSDADATGETLVAWVRREEREACARIADTAAEAAKVRALGIGKRATRVLLITGARSLADDPAAEAWARGLIAEALAGVGLLIVGDAPGPDAWASRIQRNAMRRVWCYRTRGPNARWIDTAHCEEWDRLRLWSTGVSAHPLDRNAAMVDAAAAMRDAGDDVRVLALLDGRKPRVVQPGEDRPTRGTEHTVGLAEDAGLTVDARVWPKGATT